MIKARLKAMARVARKQGDKANAAHLARVAKWAETFKGFQSVPLIGPAAPSIACEYAAATGRALSDAAKRGEAARVAMAQAYHGGRA